MGVELTESNPEQKTKSFKKNGLPRRNHHPTRRKDHPHLRGTVVQLQRNRHTDGQQKVGETTLQIDKTSQSREEHASTRLERGFQSFEKKGERFRGFCR